MNRNQDPTIPHISYERHDIERFFGIKSKKLTMVNYVFTFLIGLAITIVCYVALIPFRIQNIYLVDMFFPGGPENRSWLPAITVLMTGWALAILLVKMLKLQNQRKVFQLNLLPDDPNFVLSPRTAREILDRIDIYTDRPDYYVLLNRIKLALDNLKNLGDVTGVSECLNNQAANDEDYLHNSHTILKGFIWAIPVLGFIGTVLGLSQAVSRFGNTITQNANVNMNEMKTALSQVTSGLGTAFETTLIALVLALIVQLLTKFVESEEALFMDECACYCNVNIIAKMKDIKLNCEEKN